MEGKAHSLVDLAIPAAGGRVDDEVVQLRSGLHSLAKALPEFVDDDTDVLSKGEDLAVVIGSGQRDWLAVHSDCRQGGAFSNWQQACRPASQSYLRSILWQECSPSSAVRIRRSSNGVAGIWQANCICCGSCQIMGT